MRSAVKNRKQGSNPPISIISGVKIVLIVIGFAVWGGNFFWVLSGLYLGWGIIKGVLSCLISFIVFAFFLALFFSFIF